MDVASLLKPVDVFLNKVEELQRSVPEAFDERLEEILDQAVELKRLTKLFVTAIKDEETEDEDYDDELSDDDDSEEDEDDDDADDSGVID